MPPYVARNALLRTSQALSRLSKPALRFAHTQRRTLPDFSLEGKVAVGKQYGDSLFANYANLV
jgi:sorbose reductase